MHFTYALLASEDRKGAYRFYLPQPTRAIPSVMKVGGLPHLANAVLNSLGIPVGECRYAGFFDTGDGVVVVYTCDMEKVGKKTDWMMATEAAGLKSSKVAVDIVSKAIAFLSKSSR